MRHCVQPNGMSLTILCATFVLPSGPAHAHGNFESLVYFPVGFLASLPFIWVIVRIAGLRWRWYVICFCLAFAIAFLTSLVPLGYVPLGYMKYGAFLSGFLPPVVSTALIVFGARWST